MTITTDELNILENIIAKLKQSLLSNDGMHAQHITELDWYLNKYTVIS